MGEQAKILARVLARRLISLGVTELNAVWPVYLEFTADGGDGDFAELLVARGVATADQIERARTTPTGESGEYDPADFLPATRMVPSPRPAPEEKRHPTRRLARESLHQVVETPSDLKPVRPVARQPAIPPTWADGEAPSVLRNRDFERLLPPPPSAEEPALRRPELPPAAPLDPIDEPPAGLTPGVADTAAGSRADDPAFADTTDHQPDDAASATDAVPPAPGIGDSLGDYELTGELGRGAMGVVYEALRAGSNQDFAVKVLLLEGATRRRTARFQREMQILRQLDHPNLVRLHDNGRQGPYEWFAMDLVAGESLKKLLEDYRLAPREKLDLFRRICAGVGHAHQRGVVHRDLKPANVLVGDDGQPTVLDFGLAKQEQEDVGEQLTRSGTSLGTPWYMSPEQVTDPSGVQPTSDVFALGTMLYELVTGRIPFPGNTTGEVFYKILNHQPTPPLEINPFLDPAVSSVCMRCLEKDPSDRYPDADALGQALDAALAGQLDRGSRLARGWRWLRANHRGLALGLGLSSAVGGLALWRLLAG